MVVGAVPLPLSCRSRGVGVFGRAEVLEGRTKPEDLRVQRLAEKMTRHGSGAGETRPGQLEMRPGVARR